ncbi:uncharacterized protein LOC119303456 isoform X1 [Triticum dicoccoides]|uniref:uncharacterized protein LOC119303456 isoform X1 n=1 Tax=Triticum dicoccoides TaxID=85692 RepID=UPI00188F70D7|nr:uncharacterized protein LOC119303456 isoform X1 [Triticum dicoccoides]
MDMEIATTGDEEVDFLSDPMDRFPLPDLADEDLVLAHGRSQAVVCEPAESIIGEAGDAVLAVENDLNNTCQGIALSAPASEQSTGKDDPQAPAWVRRVQPDVFAELGAKVSELSLSAADSQLSTGKDDPQAPGWTKRVRIGRAPIERAPCAGRVCALEKTLSGYAENKTDTIVVSVVGYNFDSLGEAYDFYNLYPWEIGFGIRYGKSRLNVERTKCMQEIVRGFSVSGN